MLDCNLFIRCHFTERISTKGIFVVTSEDTVSIIVAMGVWRTSFPNQNKWPGQQKVNEAKPPIFRRGRRGGGSGHKQIHYHVVNRMHQHSCSIWMALHPYIRFFLFFFFFFDARADRKSLFIPHSQSYIMHCDDKTLAAIWKWLWLTHCNGKSQLPAYNRKNTKVQALIQCCGLMWSWEFHRGAGGV